MVKRLSKLPEKQSFFLFGPRGCGKSTLLQDVFSPDDSVFVDLLDIRLIDDLMLDPGRFERIIDSPEAKNKRVVMYSAAWCGVCKTAKKYFTEKKIAYSEYDIDTNPKAKADFDKMGGRGVPVILVGSRRMNGFSAGGFEQLFYGQ